MAFSLKFGRSGGTCPNRAPRPLYPPKGGSANHRHFSGFREEILDNRPQVREARNSAVSRQVSGDFAEFRPIGWEFPPNRAPPPQNRPDGGSSRRRDFQDFLEILRNRPQIKKVRNSALSPQLGGDFDEFRPIGRNSHGSRPFAVVPTGRRAREPPTFFSIVCIYRRQSTADPRGATFRPISPCKWRIR